MHKFNVAKDYERVGAADKTTSTSTSTVNEGASRDSYRQKFHNGFCIDTLFTCWLLVNERVYVHKMYDGT